MTKRTPLTIDEQEKLEYLFNEYKEAREIQYRSELEANTIRKEIVNIFNAHGIKEKYNHDGRLLFQFAKFTGYKYPASFKHMKGVKKTETIYLKMTYPQKNKTAIIR